jgi:hypothetical protein
MREDLRKSVYGILYYVIKFVCILLGGMCGIYALISLFGFLRILSSLGEKDSASSLFFPFLMFALGFGLFSFTFVMAIRLLRNFKEVSPLSTKRMSFIMAMAGGVFALRHLFDKAPPSFAFLTYLLPLTPFVVAIGVYAIEYFFLSRIGSNLGYTTQKPEETVVSDRPKLSSEKM